MKSHSFRSLVSCMAAVHPTLEAFEKSHSPNARSLAGQDSFAEVMSEFWYSEYGPSTRYLQELLRQYIKSVGESLVESEALLELLLGALQTQNTDMPNPEDYCYLSFFLDVKGCQGTPLRTRVYPYHNDVALRVWEAGAVLAEYLVQNPDVVRGKRVVELGAGVGLTGLVASGVCHALHVFCTDYTEVCLDNLQHNIELNQKWLKENRPRTQCLNDVSDIVSRGYLEWDDYDTNEGERKSSSEMIERATVLLGADLAYDLDCIEPLARTIRRFLNSGSSREGRVVLLATTIRNKTTFALLQEKLDSVGVNNRLEMTGRDCEALPVLFPLKFTQPRSDVAIYALSIDFETEG